MAVLEIAFIAGVVAAFGLFGGALAYVNLVAGGRAITPQEEMALRAD